MRTLQPKQRRTDLALAALLTIAVAWALFLWLDGGLTDAGATAASPGAASNASARSSPEPPAEAAQRTGPRTGPAENSRLARLVEATPTVPKVFAGFTGAIADLRFNIRLLDVRHLQLTGTEVVLVAAERTFVHEKVLAVSRTDADGRARLQAEVDHLYHQSLAVRAETRNGLRWYVPIPARSLTSSEPTLDPVCVEGDAQATVKLFADAGLRRRETRAFRFYWARRLDAAKRAAESDGEFRAQDEPAACVASDALKPAADGSYCIKRLPPGAVAVKMESAYGEQVHAAEIAGDADVTLQWEGDDFPDAEAIRVETSRNPRTIPGFGASLPQRAAGAAAGPLTATLRGAKGDVLQAVLTSRRFGAAAGFTFLGARPQENYQFEFNQEGFEPVTVSNLRVGSPTEKIQIRGTAAITAEAVDRSTGAPVAGASIWIEPLAANGARLESVEPRSEVAVVPWNYIVSAAAPGYGFAETAARRVEAKETRAVRLELERTGALRGVVRDLRSGAPIGGARVVIRPVLAPSGGGAREAWLESVQRAVTCDSSGNFLFADAPPGKVSLTAQDAGIVVSPVCFADVVPGRETAGADVRVSLGASVDGSVLAPKNYPLEGASLHLIASSGERRSSVLGSDRRFHFGPVPNGKAMLILCRPVVELQSQGDRERLPSAVLMRREIDVPLGADLNADLDVTGTLPGMIDVRITIDDRPAPNCVITSEESYMDGSDAIDAAITDADGRAAVAARAADSQTQLRILAEDGAWTYLHPTPMQVPQGEVRHIDLPIELLLGTFRPVDRVKNCFIPNSEIVGLVEFGKLIFRRPFKVDSEGRVRAVLPDGAHLFELPYGGKSGLEPVHALLDWSRSGVRAMKLPRK